MSTLTLAARDSRTMLRRSLRRMVRYPSLTLLIIGMPVVFLLLFVYVFGGTLGDGIDDPIGGRAAYINYVAPGIIVMTVAAAPQGTAILVAMDMTEGIIARFRTMAVARGAVLTGHVVASFLQTLFGLAVVIGVAILVGFRPNANALDWIGTIGVLSAFTFALVWLSVALGIQAKSVETASNTPMFLTLLPFLSSGFVPTDSMPAWLAAFAEYQPFTPVIESVRGFLTGTPLENNVMLALGWSLLIGATGYLWAKSQFNRTPVR